MKTASRSGLASAALLGGDLLCFLVFALLGLRSHEDGITASSLLRAAAPFQAGWLASSYLIGLHRRRDAVGSDAAQLVLKTWLPAWAVGLVIRSLVFGRAFAPTFAIVSLLFNSGLLLMWRCVFAPWFARDRA
ncbi:MAG TPA: DUF3054 domain-containing protein [Dehalococcoidia bacterium]|nr:DUF3054 domain-containing protein [Dehalococcoidia bacterium]